MGGGASTTATRAARLEAEFCSLGSWTNPREVYDPSYTGIIVASPKTVFNRIVADSDIIYPNGGIPELVIDTLKRLQNLGLNPKALAEYVVLFDRELDPSNDWASPWFIKEIGRIASEARDKDEFIKKFDSLTLTMTTFNEYVRNKEQD
ncbi:MAG: hypothetical protein KGH60_03125 [Candidatus Micrarchaeota archaeon]|nr:hypothetical protein [Candidatus Micrarchaeota archaeon]